MPTAKPDVTRPTPGRPGAGIPGDLLGAPDVDTGEAGGRVAAALRGLARREDLKAAVLASPAWYAVLRSAASRFVAGETRDEALTAAADLARLGHRATVDAMGEDTRDATAARRATDEFLALVESLGPAAAPLDLTAAASVSLDLSHIGLAVPDNGPRLAREHLAEIAAAAARHGRELMVSMESAGRTEAILDVHADVAARYPTVGVTVQAALHRTPEDLDALLDRPGRVRLVKGAYAEASEVASPRGPGLDARYAALASRLVAAAARGSACSIATHDAALIAHVVREVDNVGGPDSVAASLEVEMLHGVRPERLAAVRDRGLATRTYLVYGREWWLYLCHRLAEHPLGLLDALADAAHALQGGDVPNDAAEAAARTIASSARPGRS